MSNDRMFLVLLALTIITLINSPEAEGFLCLFTMLRLLLLFTFIIIIIIIIIIKCL